MGLTYGQAKAIGLGHLHPASVGVRSAQQELLDRFAAPAPKSKATSDGMNKTERAFRDDILEAAWVRGDIGNYWREPVTLRLAGRTRYTPDFLAIEKPGEHGVCPRFTFVEIKGFMRDDAAVKLKVAAEMFPCFRWLLVVRDGRHGWMVREVTSRGIGGQIWVPWI